MKNLTKLKPIKGLMLAALTLGAYSSLAADIHRNQRMLREAISYAQRYQIRPAYYKLRAVEIDVRSLPYSHSKAQLMQALGVAMEKANDPYLSVREQSRFVVDCSYQALRYLEQLGHGGGGGHPGHGTLNRSLRYMQNAVYSVRRGNYAQAAELARAAQRMLDRYRYDRDIRAAIQAADTFAIKVCDSSLSWRQRIDVANDCFGVFSRKVRESDAYYEDGGYGHGHGHGGGYWH